MAIGYYDPDENISMRDRYGSLSNAPGGQVRVFGGMVQDVNTGQIREPRADDWVQEYGEMGDGVYSGIVPLKWIFEETPYKWSTTLSKFIPSPQAVDPNLGGAYTTEELDRVWEANRPDAERSGITKEQFIGGSGLSEVAPNTWASTGPSVNWGWGTQTNLGEALAAAGLAFGGMGALSGLGLLGGAGGALEAGAAGLGSAAGGGAAEIASLADLAGFGGVGELGAGLGATAGGGLAELPFPSNLPGTNSPVLPTVPGSTGTIINGVPPVGNIASALNGLGQLPPTPNLPGTNSPTLPTVPGTTGTIIDGVPPVGTAASAAGALGSAGSAGAQGILSKIMDGTATADDWMKIAGQVGATGLGVLGSLNQTNAIKDLANQTRAERAPALNAFNSALADPSSWYSSAPAMGATDAVLRKLSVNGNPALNPGDLSKAAAYNLGGYNDYLRTMGNLGLSGQATNAQLGLEGVKSQGNIYNVLGAGLNDLTQPKPDYAKGVLDLFKNSLV